MLVVSRTALLMTAATVGAGLLAGPGAAYADDTSTDLSASEMTAALKAVGTASAHAAAQGWKTGVVLSGSSVAGSESFVTDPVRKVVYERLSFSGHTITQYTVAGKGIYSALTDSASRKAVTMMHRSSVRYVFTPDRSASLDADGMSPATLLTDEVDHAGTRTVHDDGSADYRLTEDGTTLTVRADAAGVMKSADANGDGVHMILTYAYGPQHLSPPAAAATISETDLEKGLAYLDMPATVRLIAGQAATDTLRAAHGHKITASSLRKIAKRDATSADAATGVKMVKAKSVRGGVRVYATNPWTHRSVSYTLMPNGRKVTIAKK